MVHKIKNSIRGVLATLYNLWSLTVRYILVYGGCNKEIKSVLDFKQPDIVKNFPVSNMK